MQHDNEQVHELAGVWRAAEQQRNDEIGGWIKSLFEVYKSKPDPLAQLRNLQLPAEVCELN